MKILQGKKSALFVSIILLLVSLFFIACKEEQTPARIDLFKDLTWAPATLDEEPSDVIANPENYNFESFNTKNSISFMKLWGIEGRFVWLKVDFELPEELYDMDLALYAAKLTFADKTYINGQFIGSAGRFPDDERSAGTVPRFYLIPKETVNKTGNNQLLIKLWVHTNSEIINNVQIGEYSEIKVLYENSYYKLVSIYTIFEGAFLAIAILSLILYLGQRKNKEFLIYCLINLFTAMFVLMFFAPLYPLYQNSGRSHLYSYKFHYCFCFYVLILLFGFFVDSFIGKKRSKAFNIARFSILGVQSIVTFICPSLEVLSPVFFISLIVSFLCYIPCVVNYTKALVIKTNKAHKIAVILLLGTSPFFIGIPTDIILKVILRISELPSITYLGWCISIIDYLIVMSVRYARLIHRNEYLNANLKQEVANQTKKLKVSNQRLEEELLRNHYDMEMAAIVQKRIFENPVNSFIGWDVAVAYDPLVEVSGDLYDFFTLGHVIDGFTLFDVSGHGISASLVTMLAKNIIFNCFKKSRRGVADASQIMEDINRKIISAKGNADNYMTGLMFLVSAFDSNQNCEIQLANGGHPHPLMYSKKTGEVTEVCTEDSVHQYGAIGFKDIETSFKNVNFTMGIDDILVCFTDGVTEGKNKEGKQFGLDKLKEVIKENHHKSAKDIMLALNNEFTAFRDGCEREDDITVLVLKREDPTDFVEEI